MRFVVEKRGVYHETRSCVQRLRAAAHISRDSGESDCRKPHDVDIVRLGTAGAAVDETRGTHRETRDCSRLLKAAGTPQSRTLGAVRLSRATARIARLGQLLGFRS